MIREIIKPSSNNYNIHIPEEYINQEIEILLLPLSYTEKINSQNSIFDPKEFYNVTDSTKEEIDSYLKSNRTEWDNLVTNNVDDFKKLDLKLISVDLIKNKKE